ncbi:MAG: lipocalin-like domain-containing protein [Methanocorpusculum sp.]|uniref:lipocalin-like domain-containing protein n=1 Tax=Methanocorpusculum sp. TaxID=2058474 RepID=UPI00271DAE2F|nr:lipocalin-like domain-containing protein [Methanocorpusculum sp.]MDO9523873.1 lipocalin-like domain-containing protein [Methanocorpusculum sp.]
MATKDTQSVMLDPETKENIARALWMHEYTPKTIPPDILKQIEGRTNLSSAFGERIQARIADLRAAPESFNPDYTKRYAALSTYAGDLTPHQAYAMTNLFGMDSARGYQELPIDKKFTFPTDDRPQFEYQVGWHFFVGNVFDTKDREYGVQLMFWRYSLLPPEMAKQAGLSDLENQIVEIHLAVSSAGGRHYRMRPIIVAGTTGLIDFSTNPYRYSVGKNTLASQSNDSLFPLRLQAWGIDNHKDTPAEISIDITIVQTKGYVLNGDEGMLPSCGGVGTLYYSVPNLRVDPVKSRISIDGEELRLGGGKFWYDHQWGTGFMPGGSPRIDVLRAVGLLGDKPALGWDWMEIQFDNDTEFALSAIHTNEQKEFFMQTGPTPPGIMTAAAVGSYIKENSEYFPVKGVIRVTDWVQSSVTDGQYLTTRAWYPNRVEVTVETSEVPDAYKRFVMIPIVSTGQQGFFAAGAEYSEGAVRIESPDGKRIGSGFLENVSYADACRQNLRLAGIPDTPEMIEIFAKPVIPDELKASAMAFLMKPENAARLQEELAKSRGL